MRYNHIQTLHTTYNIFKLYIQQVAFKVIWSMWPQELDVDLFSLLVYPLRSRGKDGHFADTQIVSG